MAGNNPVFQRIAKDVRTGQYAGFGSGPRAAAPAGQPSPLSAPGRSTDLTAEQLEQLYGRPSASPVQARRVTLDDVIVKTLGLFAVLLVAAAATWYTVDANPSLAPTLWWAGMLGGLGVGLLIGFKRSISVPLIIGYAALEGVFVGAISTVLETKYPGIVGTAVLATVCTFGAVFAGYRFGLVKVTGRSRRLFTYALMGYFLFSIINVITQVTGLTSGWGIGNSSGLGVLISLLGVGLASYSLAVDFDTVERGVQAQLPEKYSWLFAHGLIVSLVWLYVEMLRLIARFRG